jgi:hypothetical protein
VLEGNSEVAEKMESARARGGFKAAIREKLKADELLRNQGTWVSPTNDSWYMLLIGDEHGVLFALEKAIDERDPLLTSLAVDPLFDKLRSHPRFIEILKRVGLTHQ